MLGCGLFLHAAPHCRDLCALVVALVDHLQAAEGFTALTLADLRRKTTDDRHDPDRAPLPQAQVVAWRFVHPNAMVVAAPPVDATSHRPERRNPLRFARRSHCILGWRRQNP